MRLLATLILVAILTGCGPTTEDMYGRTLAPVVEGTQVRRGESTPFVAILRLQDDVFSPICSGTLIAPRWVNFCCSLQHTPLYRGNLIVRLHWREHGRPTSDVGPAE